MFASENPGFTHSLVFVWLAVLVSTFILLFEVLMLISAFKNKTISTKARVWWIIGMFLLHPFVAIWYFFTDHKKYMAAEAAKLSGDSTKS